VGGGGGVGCFAAACSFDHGVAGESDEQYGGVVYVYGFGGDYEVSVFVG